MPVLECICPPLKPISFRYRSCFFINSFVTRQFHDQKGEARYSIGGSLKTDSVSVGVDLLYNISDFFSYVYFNEFASSVIFL